MIIHRDAYDTYNKYSRDSCRMMLRMPGEVCLVIYKYVICVSVGWSSMMNLYDSMAELLLSSLLHLYVNTTLYLHITLTVCFVRTNTKEKMLVP